MNKKVAVSALVVAGVVVVGVGAACWYLTTPSGKNWQLNREFAKVYQENKADHFRQALPTVLPKDRPVNFEFYYENRDDQADYTESVFVSEAESFIQISTKGEVKKTPIVLNADTLNTLYGAIQTIPFDQIKVESLPFNVPKPGEVVITDEKPSTKRESLRVSFGNPENISERQNLVYMESTSTKITDQSKPNWERAKNLALEIMAEFKPKQ